MATYRVCKPIEFNNIAYFPADHFGVDKKSRKVMPPPFPTTPSGCHGQDIPVDASGVIELPNEVVEKLTLGQIAPMDDPDTPNNSGYEILGKALQQSQIQRGTEDKVMSPSGREKWVEGAERTVTPLSPEGTMTVKGGTVVQPDK